MCSRCSCISTHPSSKLIIAYFIIFQYVLLIYIKNTWAHEWVCLFCHVCQTRINICIYIYVFILIYFVDLPDLQLTPQCMQVLSVTKCRMHGTNKDEVRCRQQQRMAIVNLFSCLLMQGQRYLAAMVVQWQIYGGISSGWMDCIQEKGWCGNSTCSSCVFLVKDSESSCFTLSRTKQMLKLIHNKLWYNIFSKVKQVTSN